MALEAEDSALIRVITKNGLVTPYITRLTVSIAVGDLVAVFLGGPF